MNLYPVSIALLIFCTLITLTAGTNDPTHFTGDISINCGSIGTSAARSGKKWLGDVLPKSSSWLQIVGSSTTSTVIHKLKSADPIPQKTSRISRSQFSYSFQLNSGQKIIRLHFNPAPYKGFKGLKDLFTVEAASFTLLSNFSASLTAGALGVNSFTKEFCLNVQENQQINITFSPASSQLGDNTYAFINGIGIISIPAHLSYIHGEEIGHKQLVYVDHSTALEITHQQNIKLNYVQSSGDSDEIFPMWAILEANKIRNNIWKIHVDVGFRYLIRIYFSELGLKIGGTGDLMFKVLINDMIADTNIDIANEKSVGDIPWYRDYVVMMRGQKKEGKHDILISLQSYDGLIDGHRILEGFEILKLSNPDNSLASPNPLPPLVQDSPSQTIQTLLCVLGQRNAISTVAVIVICLVNIIVHKLREILEASHSKKKNKPSARAERVCLPFSLAEIQLATRNFSDSLLIGRGGFGKVYKGFIDKGQHVAIKRLKSNSSQGAHEFLTEIEMLSELRHVNLVSLIGYCNEHGEMILVYEYMACGTLADHLYKIPREGNNCSPLNWKQRLNICIGAGRGLDYLHTGHGIIHRDVKASNILLDDNFVAKVSDFGLAKPEDKRNLHSHVSTKVKGTCGYLDPFYFRTCKLTRKSDTYAFGVVLLEVLCGRSAVDYGVVKDERILTEWTRDYIRQGDIDKIVASSLREEISADSLKTFVGVAERCLYDEPKNRPKMSQVVLQLELALEQQENQQLVVSNEVVSVSDVIRPCNDENGLSVNPEKLTMVSPYVRNLTPLAKEQTNSSAKSSKLPPQRGKRRIASIFKPPRLWPWVALWNRFKSSNKNEILLSEIRAEIRGENIKLAFSNLFDWSTIAAATNQFSSSNKIEHYSFCALYKGVLPTGQVVAVKRCSPSSGQSIQELKTEILLLPYLRHRNIIRILGHCIHRKEKMLVSEFMENTSLYNFIEHRHLEWAVRLKIIMGIARGLVYLHQDSGLRIIHRNITTSNILLDSEMNPKIVDFGSARTSVEHLSELETSLICGTYGYMSPEYSWEGRFSVKSDVYSFGIIVLEIMTGRRISTYNISLVDYAWKLWKEGKALHMVENQSMSFGAVPLEEALRCIQVGLLCTEKEAHNRPDMDYVIAMLEGHRMLVEPQEPYPLATIEDLASGNVHVVAGDTEATFESDITLER